MKKTQRTRRCYLCVFLVIFVTFPVARDDFPAFQEKVTENSYIKVNKMGAFITGYITLIQKPHTAIPVSYI